MEGEVSLFHKKRRWDGNGEQGLELKRAAGSMERSQWEEEEEAEENHTSSSSYTVEEPCAALVPWVASPLEDPGQWARQVQLAPHEEWSLWLWNLGSMYEPLCEEGVSFTCSGEGASPRAWAPTPPTLSRTRTWARCAPCVMSSAWPCSSSPTAITA